WCLEPGRKIEDCKALLRGAKSPIRNAGIVVKVCAKCLASDTDALQLALKTPRDEQAVDSGRTTAGVHKRFATGNASALIEQPDRRPARRDALHLLFCRDPEGGLRSRKKQPIERPLENFIKGAISCANGWQQQWPKIIKA